MDQIGEGMPRTGKLDLKYDCPCCKEAVTFSDTCFQIPEFQSWRDRYSWNLPRIGDTRAWSKRRDWACKECIRAGRAVIADTRHQITNGIWTAPVPVYFEKSRHCAGCAETFSFSPHEQKAWFEEWRIPIEVKPRFCRTCRASRRAVSERDVAMRAHKEAAKRHNAPASMEALSHFYKETGKPTKADYWAKKAAQARSAKQETLAAAYAIMNVNLRADVEEVVRLLQDLGQMDGEMGRDMERRLNSFDRKNRLL